MFKENLVYKETSVLQVSSDITLSVFYGIHSDVNKPFRIDND